MNQILILFFLFLSTSVMSQVGIGTNDPDPSSILDINSTVGGMLIPRMTTAQRTAISSPAQGLMVYDTDLNAFIYHDGTNWQEMVAANSINDYTGWADYSDGVYTSASPFIVGATKVTLPNDANTVRDAQKPIDVPTLYDASTQTITGRNGDLINILIEFKARPNTAGTTRLTVSVDIGGAVGEIYPRDFVMSKGNGVEHFFLSSFNAYTLDTWETNGGTVKVVSTASTDIYDIRYVITRLHKAR
ncbi:hypothetical protein [Nonlabens xiamenensis]|uniref:hypothetical protein n=1 Tax=Nonlabens xiamenensis TaxID=2341043 RepID=UPI0013DDE772|nr:hypothetical protein [Nonlabens xiamenensis]